MGCSCLAESQVHLNMFGACPWIPTNERLLPVTESMSGNDGLSLESRANVGLSLESGFACGLVKSVGDGRRETRPLVKRDIQPGAGAPGNGCIGPFGPGWGKAKSYATFA